MGGAKETDMKMIQERKEWKKLRERKGNGEIQDEIRE